MQEEPENRKTLRLESPLIRHRPTSLLSQDISHVLTSTFKDLFAKDIIDKRTLSNLTKTQKGRSSYHARYVEELQQAHSEYSQCVKEANLLESHIIQARAQAAETESQAYERMRATLGEDCDQPGLPGLPVKSAYSGCVDEDLLKTNNLIAPQDFVTTQKPHVEPPVARKYNPAKPTLAFSKRMSRRRRGDGCSLIPHPEKTVPELDESDLNQTFESNSDISQGKTAQTAELKETKPRPKWMDKPSAQDRAEGQESLQKLKDRRNFLRNPRFFPPNVQQGGKSLIRPKIKLGKTKHTRKEIETQSSAEAPVPVFVANPSEVTFTEYSKGQVYETTLELKNMTSASRHVRVIPPSGPYFSLGLGRFPGEGGVVAPGMSCKFQVRFAPDSLRDYEDFIVVETQAEDLLVVTISAKRPPPVLTLPAVLDVGYCLVGGVKFVEFLCKNVGLSAGAFCIVPNPNLETLERTHRSEEPPFAVSPSHFLLQPEETTVVEVVFCPTTAEKCSQVFSVACDNYQAKDFSIEGQGQLVALELVSISGRKERPMLGEARDRTAEHFIRFGPCNPHSVQQKKIIIRNNVHLGLPYHWEIMKPNLRPMLSAETPEPSHIQFDLATDGAFHVSPLTGVLPPCEEEEFLVTFFPKELTDYHSVCHLVLRDVPQLPPEPTNDGLLQPVCTGLKVRDVITMEIEVKGSTEPYQILLEPYAVIVPGEIYICTLTRRKFKMWNYSRTGISLQWERGSSSSSHIIEVEPPTGRIEESECMDFELIFIGEKPGRLVTNLKCHIEHHHEPIFLHVEVSFKGPLVIVNVPFVDFGLTKLGEQTQTTILLTNIATADASWALKDTEDHKDTQILMEPCKGVLPPLASCRVDVIFMPRFCQQFETELELTVEDGTGCHLSVLADVMSPHVRLLNCELLLPDLYIGIPGKGTVTLFNQTLLPSHFSWMARLWGKHAKQCTASFDPECGTLGPNVTMEITVTFITHTDLEQIGVFALCEIQGMRWPLVLNIVASSIKKLNVSYSLPSACSTPDDESPSALLLDFGDVILKRVVTKQLLMTNQTAIPAIFTVEAQYFTGHASKTNNQSEKRFTYVKKALHSVQAKKIEDKAHEDFLNSLLAHGKGAAFIVSPESGMLGPFETQTVDVTAYNDFWGEYRDHLVCKVGELEATLIPMQMTVKGCPLYFQITGPRPDRQNQGPAIQFGTHLSGGDTVSRSLRINNPTMYDIRMDWETYNIDPSDRQMVDVLVTFGDAFPLKDADGNKVLRGAPRISDGNSQAGRERSGTPVSEGTSSSLQSTTDGEDDVPDDVCEQEEIHLDPSAIEKLISVHIRSHLGKLSDYPYCITPQQVVIPAKGSSTIHVSFTPLTPSESACVSRSVGLAVGFLSLDSEMAAGVPGKVVRAQGLDLEPLRMDLFAVVKPAALLVQMKEDEEVLEFRASAGDLLQGDSEKLVVREFDVTQTLQLRNSLEMPLSFRLGTQPPFSVLKPQPQAQLRARTSNSSNPSTGDSQSLVLQPQRSMQVKVAFHCSMSLLDHAADADEEVRPEVTLICDAGGQRKLRFQQSLLIHYSNNSLQTVPLRAHLDLATIHLSTDSINFGFCYVGQTQTTEVSLSNQGAHARWKSRIDPVEGDSHVFRMTPGSGLLGSKEPHVTSSSQCLQISFTPSKDRVFRATAVIWSPLVKTPFTLQLQGTGSFDEVYRSNLMSS